MKDEKIQMAFQLAYFIHRDPATARSLVSEAMSKLGAEILRQDKARYYNPIGRSSGEHSIQRLLSAGKQIFRAKVHLSDALLLQRLVYNESDSYERERERASNPHPVDAGTMVVHFIKHLARLAFKNNSFYASLCVSRFLHNYSTNETMEIYGAVLQNPDRVPQDDYYRKGKAKLLKELKDRFERFIRIRRVHHGEERIEPNPNSEQFLNLVKECLNQFKPWKTDFCIPPGFTYQTELHELQFTAHDPDAEHEVEIKRIHALLHYDSYERLAKGLGFDAPAKRLEIPNFVLSEASNSGAPPPSGGGDAPELSEQEIKEIQERLSKESARRKKAAAGMVRLIVDGVRVATFDARQADSISVELPEDAELLELHTNDEEGDFLLATHLLSYDWEGRVHVEQLSFSLGGGQNLSLAIAPDATGETSTLKIACQQNSKLRLPVVLPKSFISPTPVSQASRNWILPLASKSAWVLALLVVGIVSLTIPVFLLWKSKAPNPMSVAHISGPQGSANKPGSIGSNNGDSGVPLPSATQAPQPAASPAVTTPPRPPHNAGGRGKAVKTGAGLPPNTVAQAGSSEVSSEPSLETMDKTREPVRGQAGVSSLLEVKKMIVNIAGDDQAAQDLKAALNTVLKEVKTFGLTDNEQEADAMLKLEVSTRDGKLECKARCVAAGGSTIWPRAPAQKGRDSPPEKPSRTYRGDAQDIARKIVSDLQDELKQPEKK